MARAMNWEGSKNGLGQALAQKDTSARADLTFSPLKTAGTISS